MTTYETAVVGAGMIGAAAGRHLAEAGHRVAIIGPSEPADRTEAAGPFASHHDAGRITRIVDTSPVWAELAAASIERYASLSQQSGISFHERAGLVWALESERLTTAIADGLDRGADVRPVTAEWIRSETGIAVPNIDCQSYAYEGPPAGHVHPQRLVAAELAVADQSGATIVTAAVDELAWNEKGPSAGTATLSGSFETINAHRVLIATGMYGGELTGVDLAMTRWPRTTVRAELRPRGQSGQEVTKETSPEMGMPSLIAGQVAEPDIDSIYWVPPVEYPDGRVMLKIGGVYGPSDPLGGIEDIAGWFRGGGSPGEASALLGVIAELLPDLEVVSWEAVPCVVTTTTTARPYIGWLDERVAVAVGGNGGAGKSGDEIGRIAASLFDERIEAAASGRQELDRSLFKPVLQTP